ncbi:unnamed protein product [Mytilus edulis]|uniref:Exonuclease domain-containing protein n=1 Tax=Mytilus edulis TaxID=6550 RepID=A0A8S3UMX3_MYTED|nr:unnamed protein product [Mytilus edulis]
MILRLSTELEKLRFNVKPRVLILDVEQLNDFLHFQHSLGKLIYFDTLRLRDHAYHCKTPEYITSSSVSCAIEGFLSFIQQVPIPVFLAGHNIKVFDCPLLFNALENNEKVSEFVKLINGFIDTKVLLKQLPNLSSYSQENIYKSVTGNNYNAHDALEDVSSLQLLVNTSNVSIHSCHYCNYVLSSLAY